MKTAYTYVPGVLSRPTIFTPKFFITNVPDEVTEKDLLIMITKRFQSALKAKRKPWDWNLTLGFGIQSAPQEVRTAWKEGTIPVVAYSELIYHKRELQTV